jgi:S1-C subfamily serine protease
MRQRWFILMLLVGCVSPLIAQERAAAPTAGQRRARVTGPEVSQFYYFFSNRGKLGITVRIRPEPRTDSLGALVEAVTPGGPAFKVGLQSGDIITRFNGRGVTATARERHMVSPGMVLVETASTLDAGDTARIEYQRETNRRTVSVILEPMPDVYMGEVPMREPFEGPADRVWRSGELPRGMMVPDGQVRELMPLMPSRAMVELEVAPMNPGLGQYFGVNSGILVINVPQGSELNLRNGDVVRMVYGLAVTTPNQFFRALRAYEAGEPIRFDIVRMKRPMTVTGKIGP